MAGLGGAPAPAGALWTDPGERGPARSCRRSRRQRLSGQRRGWGAGSLVLRGRAGAGLDPGTAPRPGGRGGPWGPNPTKPSAVRGLAQTSGGAEGRDSAAVRDHRAVAKAEAGPAARVPGALAQPGRASLRAEPPPRAAGGAAAVAARRTSPPGRPRAPPHSAVLSLQMQPKNSRCSSPVGSGEMARERLERRPGRDPGEHETLLRWRIMWKARTEHRRVK